MITILFSLSLFSTKISFNLLLQLAPPFKGLNLKRYVNVKRRGGEFFTYSCVFFFFSLK
jgi:hypothetical protein